MTDRLVKRVTTGEVFIETDWSNPELWRVRLDAWRIDHNAFCPLPSGHKIFDHPQDYQSVRVRFKLHSNELEEY